MRPLATFAASLLVAGPLACGEAASPALSGGATCAPRGTAVSCAIVMGSVVDGSGFPLDGVTGSVRFPPSCECTSPVIAVDKGGVFSVTVYRDRALASAPDTTTGTVVLFASDDKYPRHFTGGMYFDTARVAIRFAPIGAEAPSVSTRLQITLPPAGGS